MNDFGHEKRGESGGSAPASTSSTITANNNIERNISNPSTTTSSHQHTRNDPANSGDSSTESDTQREYRQITTQEARDQEESSSEQSPDSIMNDGENDDEPSATTTKNNSSHLVNNTPTRRLPSMLVPTTNGNGDRGGGSSSAIGSYMNPDGRGLSQRPPFDPPHVIASEGGTRIPAPSAGGMHYGNTEKGSTMNSPYLHKRIPTVSSSSPLAHPQNGIRGAEEDGEDESSGSRDHTTSTSSQGRSTVGQKRRLSPYNHTQTTISGREYHPSSSNVDAQQQQQPQNYTESSEVIRGSHGPRDEARYETWTSKQLRKKCSHLKLRGLKNVKKHVMVDALYRYYRNQHHLDPSTSRSHSSSDSTSISNHNTTSLEDDNIKRNVSPRTHYRQRYDHSTGAGGNNGQHQQAVDGRVRVSISRNHGSNRAAMSPRGGGNGSSSSSSRSSSVRSQYGAAGGGGGGGESGNHFSTSMIRPGSSSGATYGGENDEEYKEHQLDNSNDEMQVTSEDVIRLVDVVLSPDFVNRLSTELSRWQFWVDVREKYISMLKSHPGSDYATARNLSSMTSGSTTNSRELEREMMQRAMNMKMISTRNFKWSSMQLWEIWKELTFAYTKACFEFTAAGMPSADERHYIKYCEGRPDVYYLHQRLHARPDLLHLIKSNEYMDECATSDASEIIAQEAVANSNNASAGTTTIGTNPHKRFKRIGPTTAAHPPFTSNPQVVDGNNNSSNSDTVTSGNRRETAISNSNVNFLTKSNAPRGVAQEEGGGSTGSSETTGEESSIDKLTSANLQQSSDPLRRAALAEQKYFGLLLQNFECIFESLHNKKVLLAALRKDSNAPDHLVADLRDDIHVLSSLKKQFRNKLRQILE